jgi:hypothetical protein
MIIMVKSKSKNSYHFYEKPVKKSKPKKEPVAFVPHDNPKPVLKRIAQTFHQEPTKTEECPCCVANCKCCDHKSGVGTGHTCTCRCHS